jgi:hypothetical protein
MSCMRQHRKLSKNQQFPSVQASDPRIFRHDTKIVLPKLNWIQ